jgi:hypothetical protein
MKKTGTQKAGNERPNREVPLRPIMAYGWRPWEAESSRSGLLSRNPNIVAGEAEAEGDSRPGMDGLDDARHHRVMGK